MRKNSELNRMICALLGIIMVLNMIVFFPTLSASAAGEEPEEVGAGYMIVTAENLYNANAILDTGVSDSRNVVYSYDEVTKKYTFNVNMIESPTSEPWVTLNMESFNVNAVDADQYAYVVVVAKVTEKTNDGNKSSILFATEGVPVKNDQGEIVSYEGALGYANTHYNYNTKLDANNYYAYITSTGIAGHGKIKTIRFDVFDMTEAGNTMVFDSFIFCNDYRLAQAMAYKRATEQNNGADGDSLNDLPVNVPVFKGRGLLNMINEYNTTSNVPTNYNYVEYDATEDAVAIKAGANKNDPWVHFGVSDVFGGTFSADTYKYIVVTYKAVLNTEGRKEAGYATIPSMMLYLMAGDVKTATASIGMERAFEVCADGNYHSIIFDASEVAKWTGTIYGFRFDFLGNAAEGDCIYIDSIGFYTPGAAPDAARVPASEAVKANITAREPANEATSIKKGQIYAYYDALALIDVYRYPLYALHTVEYDMDERAIKVKVKDGGAAVNDPSVLFTFDTNMDFDTTNTKYVVITYKIPEEYSHYKSGMVIFGCEGYNAIDVNNTFRISFNLVPDGEYHSYVLDISKMLENNANAALWTGKITRMRFDYVDGVTSNQSSVAAAGSYIYLDSILFKPDKASADAVAMERYLARTYEEGRFIARPEMMQFFGGRSNAGISMSFDEDENAIKFSVDAHYTQAGWNDVADNENGDPSFKFIFGGADGGVAGNIDTAEYPYVVVTYKANSPTLGTGNNQSVAIYPYTTGTEFNVTGSLSQGALGVYDENEYHCAIYSFSYDKNPLWSGETSGFRYDFLGRGTVGDVVYLDSIIYCKTADEAYNVAYERTWWRNHVKNADITEAGVFDHWEHQYLISELREDTETKNNYKIDIEINSDVVGRPNIDGVKLGNGTTATYDFSQRGLSAGDYKYILVTYRAADGMSDTNATVYLMAGDVTAPSDSYKVTVPIYTNVDSVAGNEAHGFMIALKDYSWWTGNINGIKLDFGDSTVYVESVIFYGGQSYEAGYELYDRVNAINGLVNQRETDAGTEYIFPATPEMVYLFDSRHMCEIGYDAAEGVIMITACNYCTHTMSSGYHHPNYYTCTSQFYDEYTGDNFGCFDIGTRFYLPGDGVTIDVAPRLVVTYSTPQTANGLEDILGEHPYPTTNNDFKAQNESLETLKGRIPVGIFPTSSIGGEKAAFQRLYYIQDQGVYYSEQVELVNESPTELLSAIRFDAFDIALVKEGAQLYISFIAMAPTEERADEIIDEQLDKYYPYNYILNFNAGTGADDPTLADLPEGKQPSRTNQHTFSFDVTYATPSRANYNFVAWKNENDVIIPLNTKITLSAAEGATQKTIVSTTLTAQWEEKKATLTYQVVSPAGNMAHFSSNSQTFEVISGNPANVTLSLVSDHFRFVGWYYDEVCTQFITSDLTLEAADITDIKVDKEDGNGKVWTDATIYAKVEYVISDMTISLDNIVASDSGQTFIVTITASGNRVANNTIDFAPLSIVMKHGDEVVIKGLYGGEYTVSVNNKWSWRFSATNKAQTINNQLESTPEIEFSYNTVTSGKWLNGMAVILS